MKKNILSLLTIYLTISSCYSQEEFSFELYFEDALGNKDTLALGYDPQATDSVDFAFAEVNIKNQIWGQIDIRSFEDYFVPDTSLLKKDIRPFGSTYNILSKFQGNELIIQWDSTLFNSQYIQGSTLQNDITTLASCKNKASITIDKSNLAEVYIENDTLYSLYFVFSNSFVGVKSLQDNLFYLYPNPSQNEINIEFSNKIDLFYYEIMNSSGQLIKKRTIGTNKISTENIPSGCYFMQVKYQNKFYSYPFIISK